MTSTKYLCSPHQGPDCECVCDNLHPGSTYHVRVACTTPGGVSPYSEVLTVSTEPVVPGPCQPPRVHGKPRANSLHLKWGWPDYDGGAAITEFTIDMTSPNNETRAVYKGSETECMVASLMPGRPYLFQVRALNRAGAGPWSDSLEVISGAGCPDTPKAPTVTLKRPNTASLAWEEPLNNGAHIHEYTLEMALVSRAVVKAVRVAEEAEVEVDEADGNSETNSDYDETELEDYDSMSSEEEMRSDDESQVR